MERRKNRGHLLLLWVSLLLVLAAGLYMLQLFVMMRKLHTAEADLRLRIEREELLGASPSRVIKFLEREKIPHSGYLRDAPVDEWDKTVSAGVGRVASGVVYYTPVSWGLDVIFRFDRKERLIYYEIKRRSTVL